MAHGSAVAVAIESDNAMNWQSFIGSRIQAGTDFDRRQFLARVTKRQILWLAVATCAMGVAILLGASATVRAGVTGFLQDQVKVSIERATRQYAPTTWMTQHPHES